MRIFSMVGAILLLMVLVELSYIMHLPGKPPTTYELGTRPPVVQGGSVIISRRRPSARPPSDGYIYYRPRLAGFNNQLQDLWHAIRLAQLLNRTLVLPRFGEGITWNSLRAGWAPGRAVRFSALFNVSVLQRLVHAVDDDVFRRNCNGEITVEFAAAIARPSATDNPHYDALIGIRKATNVLPRITITRFAPPVTLAVTSSAVAPISPTASAAVSTATSLSAKTAAAGARAIATRAGVSAAHTTPPIAVAAALAARGLSRGLETAAEGPASLAATYADSAAAHDRGLPAALRAYAAVRRWVIAAISAASSARGQSATHGSATAVRGQRPGATARAAHATAAFAATPGTTIALPPVLAQKVARSSVRSTSGDAFVATVTSGDAKAAGAGGAGGGTPPFAAATERTVGGLVLHPVEPSAVEECAHAHRSALYATNAQPTATALPTDPRFRTFVARRASFACLRAHTWPADAVWVVARVLAEAAGGVLGEAWRTDAPGDRSSTPARAPARAPAHQRRNRVVTSSTRSIMRTLHTLGGGGPGGAAVLRAWIGTMNASTVDAVVAAAAAAEGGRVPWAVAVQLTHIYPTATAAICGLAGAWPRGPRRVEPSTATVIRPLVASLGMRDGICSGAVDTFTPPPAPMEPPNPFRSPPRVSEGMMDAAMDAICGRPGVRAVWDGLFVPAALGPARGATASVLPTVPPGPTTAAPPAAAPLRASRARSAVISERSRGGVTGGAGDAALPPTAREVDSLALVGDGEAEIDSVATPSDIAAAAARATAARIVAGEMEAVAAALVPRAAGLPLTATPFVAAHVRVGDFRKACGGQWTRDPRRCPRLPQMWAEAVAAAYASGVRKVVVMAQITDIEPTLSEFNALSSIIAGGDPAMTDAAITASHATEERTRAEADRLCDDIAALPPPPVYDSLDFDLASALTKGNSQQQEYAAIGYALRERASLTKALRAAVRPLQSLPPYKARGGESMSWDALADVAIAQADSLTFDPAAGPAASSNTTEDSMARTSTAELSAIARLAAARPPPRTAPAVLVPDALAWALCVRFETVGDLVDAVDAASSTATETANTLSAAIATAHAEGRGGVGIDSLRASEVIARARGAAAAAAVRGVATLVAAVEPSRDVGGRGLAGAATVGYVPPPGTESSDPVGNGTSVIPSLQAVWATVAARADVVGSVEQAVAVMAESFIGNAWSTWSRSVYELRFLLRRASGTFRSWGTRGAHEVSLSPDSDYYSPIETLGWTEIPGMEY